MNACILVVDDDPEIVGAIAITLEREGYRVLRAYDGMEALDLALDPAVRLILIDVMMPKLDGLSALLRIREKRNLPVIVLSAKSEDTDKILGLSMGADDYVTKPFNPQELAARVRSQLRRYTLLGDVHAEERQGLIVNGRLTYDPDRRELRADGEAVKLTATETKIVDLLMRNPGRIFPAEEIYRRVWDGEAAYACENTVMVHIRRIREKNRAQSQGARLHQGGVGHWIQNGTARDLTKVWNNLWPGEVREALKGGGGRPGRGEGPRLRKDLRQAAGGGRTGGPGTGHEPGAGGAWDRRRAAWPAGSTAAPSAADGGVQTGRRPQPSGRRWPNGCGPFWLWPLAATWSGGILLPGIPTSCPVLASPGTSGDPRTLPQKI